MIHEGKIYIGQIPCLKITTDEDLKGIVIFYHGWTSTKELQSLRGHILAAYGYDVIIPEAINHGERGLIDYEENPKAYYHFGILFLQMSLKPVTSSSIVKIGIKTCL